MKILLAIDGSTFSDAAVNESGELIRGLMLSSLPLSPHAASVKAAHIRMAAEPNFINLMGIPLVALAFRAGGRQLPRPRQRAVGCAA